MVRGVGRYVILCVKVPTTSDSHICALPPMYPPDIVCLHPPSLPPFKVSTLVHSHQGGRGHRVVARVVRGAQDMLYYVLACPPPLSPVLVPSHQGVGKGNKGEQGWQGQ